MNVMSAQQSVINRRPVLCPVGAFLPNESKQIMRMIWPQGRITFKLTSVIVVLYSQRNVLVFLGTVLKGECHRLGRPNYEARA